MALASMRRKPELASRHWWLWVTERAPQPKFHHTLCNLLK